MPASRVRRRLPTVRVDPRGLSYAELAGRFEDAVASPWYQAPPLPESGLRLIDLSQRSDVTFEDILPMLLQDEAIAARVLAVAQSARYATRAGIHSLGDALVRLGIEARLPGPCMSCGEASLCEPKESKNAHADCA